ncbi:MAG: hypothetical protein IPP76_12995 [Moraxellaceae bacterium]|nr:hypothetical protein [Moraxellaceae bacterium]
MLSDLRPALLKRSYYLAPYTNKELREADNYFKGLGSYALVYKRQAVILVEEFCRHLRNLVLDS